MRLVRKEGRNESWTGFDHDTRSCSAVTSADNVRAMLNYGREIKARHRRRRLTRQQKQSVVALSLIASSDNVVLSRGCEDDRHLARASLSVLEQATVDRQREMWIQYDWLRVLLDRHWLCATNCKRSDRSCLERTGKLRIIGNDRIGADDDRIVYST